MTTAFPANLDAFVNPAPGDSTTTVSHAAQHDNANDALAALEKVGVGPIWYTTKGYGLAVNGTTDDSAALAALNTTAAGNTIRATAGTSRLAGTLALTTALQMPPGALFSVDSGKTLTINGPLDAGPYQIFSGAGTVVLGPKACDAVLPEWWGADRTGAVPSDAAMLAAIATGKPVMLGGVYLMAGATVPNTVPGCHLYGHGEITGFKLANAANVPALTLTGGIPHVTLRQFAVDGNQANQTANSLYRGISVGNNNGVQLPDVTIEDLLLKNGNDIGLFVESVQNCHIRGIRSTQWARPVCVTGWAYDSSIGDVVATLGPQVPGGSAPIAVTIDVLGGVGTHNCTVSTVTAAGGGALFLNGCVGVNASALTCRGIQDIGVDLEFCADCTVEGIRCDGTGGSAIAQGAWLRSCQRCTIAGTVSNCAGQALQVWGLTADVEARIVAVNCATAANGYAFNVTGIGYDSLVGITSTVAALLTNGQSVPGRNIRLAGCSGGQGAQFGGFNVTRDLNLARVTLDSCVGSGTFPFILYPDHLVLKGCRSVKPGQWGYYLLGASYGSYGDCGMEFAPGSPFRPIELAGGPGVAAPAAPTLAHAAAGSGLGAGTVFVRLDSANGVGRTLPSAATSVAVAAGDKITTSLNFPAEGIGVYVGTTSTPLLLGTVYADGHVAYSGTSTTGLAVAFTYNSSSTLQANLTITALASGTGAAALGSRTDRCPCQHNRFSGFDADGGGSVYDYVLKEDQFQATLDGTHDYNEIVGTRSNAETSGIASFQGSHSRSETRVGPAAFAPAVPASTVGQVNTTGQDYFVYIFGGAVTGVSITIGGTNFGVAVAGPFLVPAGATIAVTYSAAPAWLWVHL